MPEYQTEEDKARGALLLSREKMGVQDLADTLGTHRQKVSAFLNGKPIDDPKFISRSIHWAKENGYWIWSEASSVTPQQQAEWAFNKKLLGALLENKPEAKLALGLRDLAEKLIDGSLSSTDKRDEVVKFLEYLSTAVRRYVAELDKGEKGSV